MQLRCLGLPLPSFVAYVFIQHCLAVHGGAKGWSPRSAVGPQLRHSGCGGGNGSEVWYEESHTPTHTESKAPALM